MKMTCPACGCEFGISFTSWRGCHLPCSEMADYKAVEPTTATAPNTEMLDRVLKACSYCGVQTVGSEATACARCGKPFLPPQSEVRVARQEGRAQMSGALRLCPKCQSKIAEQAVFCERCGVNVATGRTAVENGIQNNAIAPSGSTSGGPAILRCSSQIFIGTTTRPCAGTLAWTRPQ